MTPNFIFVSSVSFDLNYDVLDYRFVSSVP